MSSALDRFATFAVGLAALSVGAVVIKREFFPPPKPVVADGGLFRAPVEVRNWRQLFSAGTWIGDSNAKAVVVEFSDFECPFCRKFHSSYQTAKAALGDSIALLVIHLPIQGHRFARPAARAAMCALKQGRFAEYHDALFQKPDSFGLKSWASYGVDAHVPDTNSLARCASETGTVASIERGVAVADSMGVDATPTVIINGWRYFLAPTDSLTKFLRGYAQAAH